MLPLPILDVQLRACATDWQQMTPTQQGRYCSSCHRTVLDFTQATQPELEAAFLAASDGRVCGRFRPAQLAATPLLRPKLRRFLVVLLLVCGLGLSAREAVGQVREATRAATPSGSEKASLPFHPGDIGSLPDEAVLHSAEPAASAPLPLIGYVEQVPIFKGGTEALVKFIGANLHWPAEAPATLNGRVFVKFQVTETGAVRDVQVVKGLHPALDAEAVRVVKLLDGQFTPGQQNNRPVQMSYTLPFTFQAMDDIPSASPKRKPK